MPLYLPQQILPASTWANRPAANSVPAGTILPVTGLNNTGEIVYLCSNGTTWRPLNGTLNLAMQRFPVGIAGVTGAMTAGAFSFTNAVTYAYGTSRWGGVWLYYPADTIVSGQPAGFYWTVMSSTTAAIVYNNTYTPGGSTLPPASPTAFVGNGPGVATGATHEITVWQYTLPGGLLGLYGLLDSWVAFTYSVVAGTKSFRYKVAGTTLTISARTTSGGFDRFLAYRLMAPGKTGVGIAYTTPAHSTSNSGQPSLITADFTADGVISSTIQHDATAAAYTSVWERNELRMEA